MLCGEVFRAGVGCFFKPAIELIQIVCQLLTCVAFRGEIKKTLSKNNIKCGKLLIVYSTINCTINYTTIGKYCKLINC